VNENKPLVRIQSTDSQNYTGTQELLDSEAGLIGYSTAIVSKLFAKMELQSRIVENKGKLLEFGAGTGFLAEIFRSKFHVEPVCIELDPNLLNVIKTKNFDCFQFINQTQHKYAGIYTSNVLEHIEDDSAVLIELHNSLTPGGVIGIYVPAHPMLYSTMDKEIGHVRRYTRSELREKILAAGFTIESIAYDDFIGFFASVVVKLVGYKNSANLGSKKSLIFYDKIIYPLSRLLDFIGFRYILGKNLIVIAIK
jgi:SAM-dependent methyltransferase